MQEIPMSELLPQQREMVSVTADNANDVRGNSDRTLVTRDQELIRRWAERRKAEPATGEATSTGPATAVSVNDGGAGIRFNFPGAAPFRPISWEEWFDHLERNDLVFAYEDEPESQNPSAEYRIVPSQSLPTPRF
jgi:hypothetical protein